MFSKGKKRKGFTYAEVLVSMIILATVMLMIFSSMTAIHKDSVYTRGYTKLNYYITSISESIVNDAKDDAFLVVDLGNKNSDQYKNYQELFRDDNLNFEIESVEEYATEDKDSDTTKMYYITIKAEDTASGVSITSGFFIKKGAFR